METQIEHCLRYDIGEATLTQTGDGFLKARVVIARAGVFPYLTAAGTIRREAKLPSELFSEITLNTAKGIPVTDGHPPYADSEGLITPENWHKYVKGSLGDDITVSEGYINAHETIYDQSLIEDLKAGRKVQVSIGFRCDVAFTAGEYGGEQYDAVQKNIRINHLAHVPAGRGGETVRAYLDAAEDPNAAVQMDKKEQEEKMESKEEKNPVQAEDANVLLDGLKKLFAFFARAAEPQGAEQKQQTEGAKGGGESAENKSDAAAAIAALEAKLQEQTARADALQAVIDASEKQNAAAEQAAKLDAAIDERLALIETAKAVVQEFKHDGKSNREIKLAVIEAALPFGSDVKTDSLDDVVIDARYDAAVSLARKQASSQAGAAATPRLDANEIEKKRQARLNIMEKEA